MRLHEIRSIAATDPAELSTFAATEHHLAHPVPTGAVIASTSHIESVRAEVTAAVEEWLRAEPVPRNATSAFDIALGKALHDSLNILPADAAHQETWSFLAAVVFPDVVWARFPDLHQDRVLGRPRNTLRRAWLRHDVIGDLQVAHSKPLGEDELTGIFERTAVAANRRLARALAQEVLGSEAGNRSLFARGLYKRVTDLTGPLLLDVLTDEELQDLVAASADGQPWPPPEPNAPSQAEPPRLPDARAVEDGLASGSNTEASALPEMPEPAPTEEPPAESEGLGGTQGPRSDDPPQPEETIPGQRREARPKATGDLIRQFHKDMIFLSLKVKHELGYSPTALFDLVDTLGGVEAARRVVGAPHVSPIFTTLWERRRLDLTVEYLVLDSKYQGLFGEQLIAQAKFRLEQHGLITDSYRS